MTEDRVILDPTTNEYWASAADSQLVVQRCVACGHHQFYPRPFCLDCDSRDLEWTDTPGVGTVYSCAMVHVNVREDVPPPYTVGLVELDEGPRLLARVPDDAAIGDRVTALWLAAGEDERPVLSFVSAEAVGEAAS